MDNACFYHPQNVAKSVCGICGRATCAACESAGSAQPTCRRCEIEVGDARRRGVPYGMAATSVAPPPAYGAASPLGGAPTGLSAPTPEMGAGVVPAGNNRAPLADALPMLGVRSAGAPAGSGTRIIASADAVWPPSPQGPAPLAAPPIAASLMRMVPAIGVGLVVGVLGAALWAVVTQVTHFNIGYLTVLIGYAVGFAIVRIAHRSGPEAAIVSTIISLFSQLLGYYLLLNYYAGVMFHHGIWELPLGVQMQATFHTIDAFSWLMIALGCWAAFKSTISGRWKARD